MAVVFVIFQRVKLPSFSADKLIYIDIGHQHTGTGGNRHPLAHLQSVCLQQYLGMKARAIEELVLHYPDGMPFPHRHKSLSPHPPR